MGKEPERHFNFFVLIFMPIHFLTNFFVRICWFRQQFGFILFFHQFSDLQSPQVEFHFFFGRREWSTVASRKTVDLRRPQVEKNEKKTLGIWS